jgi:hypothetical protein
VALGAWARALASRQRAVAERMAAAHRTERWGEASTEEEEEEEEEEDR